MTDDPSAAVPATPMVSLYDETHARGVGREKRLALARGFVAVPGALAALFAESVRRMAAFQPGDRGFYAGPRIAKIGDEITKTHHFALRLERDQSTKVLAGANAHSHDLPPGVAIVPAERLAFRYIDRELVGSHVLGGASQEDTAVRMDLLLATLDDDDDDDDDDAGATAIIGELKIGIDKDPFAALIQAMACAAQMIPLPQYQRLRAHAKSRHECLRELSKPFVDIYIFLHGFQADNYLLELLSATQTLSGLLLSERRFSRHVRRVACLMTEAVDDRIVARSHFALQRRVPT